MASRILLSYSNDPHFNGECLDSLITVFLNHQNELQDVKNWLVEAIA